MFSFNFEIISPFNVSAIKFIDIDKAFTLVRDLFYWSLGKSREEDYIKWATGHVNNWIVYLEL